MSVNKWNKINNKLKLIANYILKIIHFILTKSLTILLVILIVLFIIKETGMLVIIDGDEKIFHIIIQDSKKYDFNLIEKEINNERE